MSEGRKNYTSNSAKWQSQQGSVGEWACSMSMDLRTAVTTSQGDWSSTQSIWLQEWSWQIFASSRISGATSVNCTLILHAGGA